MSTEQTFIRRADHGARILVVDDDPLARVSLRAMLERSSYQVHTVESGMEALAWLGADQPDLVLLDIMMPEMDGLETCRRIRALPNGDWLPIIFLTAEESPAVLSEAFRAKGDDLLRKPVLSSELIVRIRSLMRLKRMQAEIQAERDILLDLQRQREVLFGFIVHDLKNPLTTIQIGLEFLSECLDVGQAAHEQLLRLRDTGRFMGRMIQNILDIGRAEQVGLELRKARIELGDWLPVLVGEMEARARRANQTLAWDCAEGLEAQADPDFLRRLILNLLDNALKYSPSGSRTKVVARSYGRALRLEVRDQGRGVPEPMRGRIFEPFVRVQDEPRPSRTSSGLGLAFCKLVAEAHGGRIWVESNPAGGSVFVLEIPAAA